MLDDLTDDESALVAAARDGRTLVCADHAPIRAELIRELLLGRRGELDPRGVRLDGARLDGALELAYVTAVVGLILTKCVIDEQMELSRAVISRLVLAHSRIGGIRAVGLRVGNDLNLDGATVFGTRDTGAVNLHDAHVGGTLTMVRAKMSHDAGTALRAEGLTVGDNLLLEHARVSGAGNTGAIDLSSARVGNDVYIVDTEVRNDTGPALYADGLRVDDTLVLLKAKLSGAGGGGAIWLLGAQLGGLRVVETAVRNDSGTAVFADQLQVDGHLLLEKVRLSAAGDDAVLRLAVARVSGQFAVKGVKIGPTVDLVDHDPATCDGTWLVDVNDLSYGSLTGVGWRQWLHLVRSHTKEYRPSPYQQLAAVERAAGHDGNARNILITQQHDLRHRSPAAVGGWLTRRFHWLWGALAGYGYRARRTALALLVALAVAGLVSLWAGHITTGPGRHAAEHTIASARPGTPCSTVELIGLGLDRGLPLGPTGLRSRCDLDTETAAGQTFTVLLWIVQAAVWGLATLALAGYTGLIRKTA